MKIRWSCINDPYLFANRGAGEAAGPASQIMNAGNQSVEAFYEAFNQSWFSVCRNDRRIDGVAAIFKHGPE
jgi:hypothetical protein